MEEKQPSRPVSFTTYRTPRSAIAFLVLILGLVALLLGLGFASGNWPGFSPDPFLTTIFVLQVLFVIVIGAFMTQPGARSFGMKLVYPFTLHSPASTLVSGFFFGIAGWASFIMFQRERAYDVGWVTFSFVGGQLGVWTWRLLRGRRAREPGDEAFSMQERGMTLAEALLFLLPPLVTWIPAAFLIEWLGVTQLPGMLLSLGYLGVSLFVWDRFLIRRQATDALRGARIR